MNEVQAKPKRIAIQGGYGAFHEIAALNYFENEEIEIIPRTTFKDLFHALKEGHVDYGITAIENSIAGSILPNYNLLLESNLSIIGEIYLRIQQNLVALPGQRMEDIREVHSHPMAILQCMRFFDEYPQIMLVDSADTALCAKEIAEKKIAGRAAISSKKAAGQYHLEIIAESIETHKMNYTRFLILKGKNGEHPEIPVANKATITFALAHKIGCLSKVLSILSFYNINLAKIQSMPIVGKEWEYQFFVDLEIEDYTLYLQAVEAVKPFTSHLLIFGEYLKGRSVLE